MPTRRLSRSRPASGWECPRCGRRFVQKTREHSCNVIPLEAHLDGKPLEVRETFDALERMLDSLGGNYRIAPLKTMIVLSAAKNFGSIKVLGSGVDVGFLLGRRIDDPRIRNIHPYGPNVWAHEVRIGSASEVDAELRSWLGEALGRAEKPKR